MTLRTILTKKLIIDLGANLKSFGTLRTLGTDSYLVKQASESDNQDFSFRDQATFYLIREIDNSNSYL